MVFLAGLGTAPTCSTNLRRCLRLGFMRSGSHGAASARRRPRRRHTNLDTLVADIRAVLDTLSLRSVTVVGHSIAGEEMTRFGETSSARCTALVYLDAAYDRTDVRDASERTSVATTAPERGDTATFASIEALYARVLGVREPESEIRATADSTPTTTIAVK